MFLQNLFFVPMKPSKFTPAILETGNIISAPTTISLEVKEFCIGIPFFEPNCSRTLPTTRPFYGSQAKDSFFSSFLSLNSSRDSCLLSCAPSRCLMTSLAR
jgi:hypothetical protein